MQTPWVKMNESHCISPIELVFLYAGSQFPSVPVLSRALSCSWLEASGLDGFEAFSLLRFLE